MEKLFRTIATKASQASGHAQTFVVALIVILIWAVTGPIFDYSNTWQLMINTGTTIVTFLMVFLIQNTQNRDSLAMHLKLDELIKSVKGARNSMVNVEELSDTELQLLHEEFRNLHEKSFREITRRKGQIRIREGREIVETK